MIIAYGNNYYKMIQLFITEAFLYSRSNSCNKRLVDTLNGENSRHFTRKAQRSPIGDRENGTENHRSMAGKMTGMRT